VGRTQTIARTPFFQTEANLILRSQSATPGGIYVCYHMAFRFKQEGFAGRRFSLYFTPAMQFPLCLIALLHNILRL